MESRYMRLKQAAEFSSIPLWTLYYYISKGILSSYKVAGRQLLKTSEFIRFIEFGGIDGKKKTG